MRALRDRLGDRMFDVLFVNAVLMKCFAARHQGDPRAMLLVAPGWVRTDMGGTAASLSVEESIPFVVDSVERCRGKPGLRFIDRNDRTLAW